MNRYIIAIILMAILEGCSTGLGFALLPLPHNIGVNTGTYIPSNSDYNIGYSTEAYADVLVNVLVRDGRDNENVIAKAIRGPIPYIDFRVSYGQLGAIAKSESNLNDMVSRYFGVMFVVSPPTPVISSYLGVGRQWNKVDFEGDRMDGSATFWELGLGHTFKYGSASFFVRYTTNTSFEEPVPFSPFNSTTVGVNLSVGLPWRTLEEEYKF